MQLTSGQVQQVGDPAFANKVKEVSGAGLERCYQCHTCSLDKGFVYVCDLFMIPFFIYDENLISD